jgi:NAD+ synthase (glutamine-hydrolysing)
MNNGFVRVAAAVPELKVADCAFNASKIIEQIQQTENDLGYRQ